MRARHNWYAAGWRSETCDPRARCVARAGKFEAERGEPRIAEVDQVRRERHAFCAQRIDAGRGEQRHAGLDRGKPDDVRRACREPVDRRRRIVDSAHRELIALTEPAPDRLPQGCLQFPAHVEKSGRPWAAVEVLVRAADRKVDTVGVQRNRHRPDRMAQIPQHQRTCVVRRTRDARDVGDRRRSVVDVRQAHQRRVRSKIQVGRRAAGERIDVDVLDAQPTSRRETLEHVTVGREVSSLGDDRPAVRPRVERRGRELVEVHRGRVADQHLARPGTEKVRADEVAHDRRQFDPRRPARVAMAHPMIRRRPPSRG